VGWSADAVADIEIPHDDTLIGIVRLWTIASAFSDSHNGTHMKPAGLPIRLYLTPDAKHTIETICDNLGMTQLSLLSRLIDRFAAMPRSAQAALLGLLPPEFEPQIVRLILDHLQDEKSQTPSAAPATPPPSAGPPSTRRGPGRTAWGGRRIGSTRA
jgi:hypothetical protein